LGLTLSDKAMFFKLNYRFLRRAFEVNGLALRALGFRVTEMVGAWREIPPVLVGDMGLGLSSARLRKARSTQHDEPSDAGPAGRPAASPAGGRAELPPTTAGATDLQRQSTRT
jgi:hypothetical protein